MLAVEFSVGPLLGGLVVAALGVGLLLSRRLRVWGLLACVTSIGLVAISVVSAPSKYEEWALTFPEAQSVPVVAVEDGYGVTVEIGDCLTLYRVDSPDWQPYAFDQYPGDQWDVVREQFCSMVLNGRSTVNLPDEVKEGSWGLCDLSNCYVLENG